jgi:phosphoribosylpyrophosphate synthetase
MKRLLLFFAPAMELLARQIAELMPDRIELGNITWAMFRDGTPNFSIQNAGDIRGRHVVFLAHMAGLAEIAGEISAIREIPLNVALSLHIVLPYCATASMERMTVEGTVVTGEAQAAFFSLIGPCHRGGPPLITIFDPHTLSLRGFFEKAKVVVDLKTALSLLGQRLAREPDRETYTIVFPDNGARSRFGLVIAKPERGLSDLPIVVCDKVKNVSVTIREGNPRGRKCVIIDDLIQRGTTLDDCGRALLDAGALEVSAFCTHGVFPEQSWRRFMNGPFKHLWITDSCPESAAALRAQGSPFEILSLAPRIADLVTSLDG